MDRKDYQKIVNQLGRTLKIKSLDPLDKKTLYNVRLKYYNKIKDVENMKAKTIFFERADEIMKEQYNKSLDDFKLDYKKTNAEHVLYIKNDYHPIARFTQSHETENTVFFLDLENDDPIFGGSQAYYYNVK